MAEDEVEQAVSDNWRDRLLANLRHRARSIGFQSALHLMQGRARGIDTWRWCAIRLKRLVATLVILPFAAGIATWGPVDWSTYKASEIGIGIGGALATVLALLLTLSVVPAQRAADQFSASILHLYARDRTFVLVFGGLVSLVVIAFLSGSGLVNGWPRAVFAVHFSLFGVAVDGLRMLYRRSLILLNPANGARLLTEYAIKHIGRVDREVRLLAAVERLNPNAPKIEHRLRMAIIYRLYPNLTAPLGTWTKELLEMAAKAIDRQEQSTVKTIFDCLASVALNYLSIRGHSSIFAGTGGDDADEIVNPIYEGIMALCKQAANDQLEDTCRAAIRTLGHAAASTAQMVSDNEGIRKAPYLYMPLSYMEGAVEFALYQIPLISTHVPSRGGRWT